MTDEMIHAAMEFALALQYRLRFVLVDMYLLIHSP
jgi:hypothetical protein